MVQQATEYDYANKQRIRTLKRSAFQSSDIRLMMINFPVFDVLIYRITAYTLA